MAGASAVLVQTVNAPSGPSLDTTPPRVSVLLRLPFLLAPSGVALHISISGCGTVSGDGGGLHQYGDSEKLTATACTGSIFVGWSGGGPDCDGRSTSQCVVTFGASDLSITALFAPLLSGPDDGV